MSTTRRTQLDTAIELAYAARGHESITMIPGRPAENAFILARCTAALAVLERAGQLYQGRLDAEGYARFDAARAEMRAGVQVMKTRIGSREYA